MNYWVSGKGGTFTADAEIITIIESTTRWAQRRQIPIGCSYPVEEASPATCLSLQKGRVVTCMVERRKPAPQEKPLLVLINRVLGKR